MQHAFLTLCGIDRARGTFLVSPSGKYSCCHFPITLSLQEAITEYLIRTNQTEDDLEGLRIVVSIKRARHKPGMEKYVAEDVVLYNILPKR